MAQMIWLLIFNVVIGSIAALQAAGFQGGKVTRDLMRYTLYHSLWPHAHWPHAHSKYTRSLFDHFQARPTLLLTTPDALDHLPVYDNHDDRCLSKWHLSILGPQYRHPEDHFAFRSSKSAAFFGAAGRRGEVREMLHSSGFSPVHAIYGQSAISEVLQMLLRGFGGGLDAAVMLFTVLLLLCRFRHAASGVKITALPENSFGISTVEDQVRSAA